MRIRYGGKLHDVYLSDDGTLDTVIEVDGTEHRFDGEYAAEYRDRDGAMTIKGLRSLALEVLADMI